MPRDRTEFLAGLLPYKTRLPRRDGFHLFNTRYRSDALVKLLGRHEQKLMVRYDPRDLSRGVPSHISPPDTPASPESAPGGLTARQSDGDVAHRGIRLGSVPVALTRLEVSYIADLDLMSLGFRGDPPAARANDQNLIAIVNMPACVASLAEVHDAAIEIF